MIAYIRGKLTHLQDESIIVDVNGVGYEVICSNPFIFQDALNEELFIYTYHHIREDNQSLFGFKHEDEKYLFTKLLSVSGIGPKGALAVLASANVSDFISAVEQEDEKYLTTFPGIGKKTARQIILDLKGKLTDLLSVTNQTSKEDPHMNHELLSNHLHEAEEALKALGYTDRELRSILPKLQQETNANTDELIRKALSMLVKN